MADIEKSVAALLDTIQKDMYERAKAVYADRRKVITKWEELVPTLDSKCVAVLPWCEEEACEDDIKERSGRRLAYIFCFYKGSERSLIFVASAEPQDERAPSAGAKSLAIPFDQTRWSKIIPGKTKCPACGRDAKRWTMFGRSY